MDRRPYKVINVGTRQEEIDSHFAIAIDREKSLEAVRQRALPLDQALESGAPELIEKIRERLLSKMAERGITNPSLPPFFIVEDAKSLGTTKPHHIEIRYLKDVGGVDLRTYETLLVLGHEWYHATAITKAILRHTNPNATGGELNYNFSGMVQFNTHAIASEIAPGGALEEGMAVDMELELQVVLREYLTAKRLKILTDLDDYVRKESKHSYSKISYHIIAESPEKSNVSFEYYPNYNHSMQLVDYLRETIPHFYELIEQARVRGERLPLARALTKVFGAEYRQRILKATCQEAQALLEELKQRTVTQAPTPSSG